MTKISSQNKTELLKAGTPDILVKLFEWASRTNGVIDQDFINLTPYLTLTWADVDYEKPPTFMMVGRMSAAREVFGDSWADNVRETQETPIADLDKHSAHGYLKAAETGANYDLVDFDTGSVRGTYRRLIVPVRANYTSTPLYYAMLPVPINIEKSALRAANIYSGIIEQRANLH